MASPSEPTRPSTPALAALAALLGLQGLALLAAAAFLGVELVRARPDDVGRAVLSALLALGAAAGLAAVARGLGQGRRWARAPALVTEMIALPIGWSLVQGGVGWIGVPLLLTAVAVLGLVVSRPVTAALDTDRT